MQRTMVLTAITVIARGAVTSDALSKLLTRPAVVARAYSATRLHLMFAENASVSFRAVTMEIIAKEGTGAAILTR